MTAKGTRRADIGILTVIPTELEWTRKALSIDAHDRRKVPSGRIYYFGFVPSQFAGRDYSIAITCIGDAGTAECAVAATALIKDWRPKLVILVGIAAGLRGQVKVGSVILSERIWSYEKAAVTTAAGGRARKVPRPDAPILPLTIQQDVTCYLSGQDRLQRRLAERFRALGGSYPAIHSRNVVTAPDVHSATVASGNKLLRHEGFLYKLRATGHGRTEVAEMEAAGLTVACREGRADWLVIRGVSDFGDKRKTAEYQPFAAQMAAAVTRDFIEVGLQLTLARRPKAKRVLPIPQAPTRSEIVGAAAEVMSASPAPRPPPSGVRMLEFATGFERHVYRILRVDRDFGGASIPRSVHMRWNPGLGVLYFAMSAQAALAEVMVSPANAPPWLLIAEFRVRLSYVLDLTDQSVRHALGINWEAIQSRDRTYSESVAEAARVAGCEGLLVLSPKGPGSPMLVVFDRIAPGSEIVLLRTGSAVSTAT